MAQSGLYSLDRMYSLVLPLVCCPTSQFYNRGISYETSIKIWSKSSSDIISSCSYHEELKELWIAFHYLVQSVCVYQQTWSKDLLTNLVNNSLLQLSSPTNIGLHQVVTILSQPNLVRYILYVLIINGRCGKQAYLISPLFYLNPGSAPATMSPNRVVVKLLQKFMSKWGWFRDFFFFFFGREYEARKKQKTERKKLEDNVHRGPGIVEPARKVIASP